VIFKCLCGKGVYCAVKGVRMGVYADKRDRERRL